MKVMFAPGHGGKDPGAVGLHGTDARRPARRPWHDSPSVAALVGILAIRKVDP